MTQHGGLDDLYEAAGERRGEQRALIVLGVIGLAFGLILTAFFVGRGFSDNTDRPDEAPPQAAPGDSASGSDARSLAEAALGGRLRIPGLKTPRPSPKAAPTPRNGRLTGPPWQGGVRPAAVRGAGASCRAKSSVDAGGNRVGYPASNMLDRTAATAWRCTGNGRGVTLTFNLGRPQRIAEVGLVPGYAKTDPFNGVDRYAENRRIARVRWTFGGDRWVEQKLSTSADRRGLQTLRIPAVRARRVTLTIKNTVSAKRNTVAISTVSLARARG